MCWVFILKKRPRYQIDDIAHIDDLDELIAIAYDVFAIYLPHRPLEVCTYCCMDENNVALIYKTPVQELPRAVIYDYLDSAQCDDRALSDEIRYFAPRIFELLYQGQELRHSTELTFDKFHLELGVWSDIQMRVFNRFCELYFKYLLTRYDDDKFRWIQISDTLLMFYKSGLKKLDELLTILFKSLNNDIALINLCHEIYWGLADEYDNAFCDDGVFNQMIDEWINDKYVKHIIAHKILALTQKDIYQKIDDEKRYWVEVAFDKMSG